MSQQFLMAYMDPVEVAHRRDRGAGSLALLSERRVEGTVDDHAGRTPQVIRTGTPRSEV